jgi:NAD(P)-dependent dehydrogenase (short-subunit alcohol dehydrogenase family)
MALVPETNALALNLLAQRRAVDVRRRRIIALSSLGAERAMPRPASSAPPRRRSSRWRARWRKLGLRGIRVNTVSAGVMTRMR